jgi:hypothetical protein
MSELVLAALRALGPAPSPSELESVAATLRDSRDPEVGILFGDWEGLRDLVLVADAELAFVGLDLYSEFTAPGAQREVLARGRPVEGA